MKLLQQIEAVLSEAVVAAHADMTASEVMAELRMSMAELADEFKDHAVPSRSAPSAPNTSVFRASSLGTITLEKDVITHNSNSGSTRWAIFLKIGGAIDTSISKKIISELLDAAWDTVSDEYIKNDHNTLTIFAKDAMVIVGVVDGSNWGGIGAYVRPFDSAWRPSPK